MMPTELLNHLWQSTCVVAVVGLLCVALRSDAARIRYALWWLASIKFLVPLSLLARLSERMAASSEIAPAIGAGLAPAASLVVEPVRSMPTDGSFTPLLGFVWGLGTLLVLFRWYRRSRSLRGLIQRADKTTLSSIDGSTPIDVLRTRERIEPGIVGLFRPCLLLPMSLERRLTPPQLQAVIAHEISHIRRRDNLTAAIHMLVEAIFWFYPLVWWLGARLIDERERACDETVIALGHDAACYADAILSVCEHYIASPLRSAAGISGSDLKQRVIHVMRYRGMNKLIAIKKFLLGGAGVVLMATPLIAGLAIQRPALAQDHACRSPDLRMRELASGVNFVPGVVPDLETLGNGPHMPIVKVAPIYPPEALEAGLEGFVVIAYTVRTDGHTDDIEIVESSSSLFEPGALDTAGMYLYFPCVIDGEPTAVPNERTQIIFTIEGNDTRRRQPPPRPQGLGEGPIDTIIVTGSLD